MVDKMYSLVTATDETFGVEDSVAGIHSSLILGSITDQTLFS
jgi:hypothetical protein